MEVPVLLSRGTRRKRRQNRLRREEWNGNRGRGGRNKKAESQVCEVRIVPRTLEYGSQEREAEGGGGRRKRP